MKFNKLFLQCAVKLQKIMQEKVQELLEFDRVSVKERDNKRNVWIFAETSCWKWILLF